MPLFAASGEQFYENLYRRGLAHFQDGSYTVAMGEMRLAAFGFVDSVERFETAQAWVAAAAIRAHRDADVRLALERIVAAQNIEPHFATIDIPADIRRDIETAAKSLLKPADLARLNAGANARPTTVRTNTATDSLATTPDTITVEKAIPEVVPEPQPQTPTSQDPNTLIAEGDRAIAANDLAAARTAYTTALTAPNLSHAMLIKIGTGLSRARGFREAATAFERAGAFEKGEETSHYYYAIALYETGQYAAAKRELAAALPFIEMTPDVRAYRAKIEGAQ